MTDVLIAARRHWKAQQNAPIGQITVPEWKYADDTVVVLDIRRLNAQEQAFIVAGEALYGDRGRMVRTVMLSCFFPGEKRRAFVDTDEKALLEDVDPSIIERIYEYIRGIPV